MKKGIIQGAALVVLCALLAALLYLYATAQQNKADHLQVHFFDFSNEDAILIQYRGRAALIDTAEPKHSEELLLRLDNLGVERLDLLILTHPDQDHIGGAPAVLGRYPVDTIVQSPYQKHSGEERALQQALEDKALEAATPQQPLHIDWDGLTLDIYPPGEAAQAESNESSLVTVLEYGEIRMVFAGDAESLRLQEMMALPLAPCTLYKLPHHGRDNEMSAGMIEALRPRYAVVTAPAPEAAVQQALDETGTRVYSTAGKGVLAISDGVSLSVAYVEMDSLGGKG